MSKDKKTLMDALIGHVEGRRRFVEEEWAPPFERDEDDDDLFWTGYRACLATEIRDLELILRRDGGREARLIAGLLDFRSRCGTGPAGGQVRANIDALLREVYGAASPAPAGGVFDE